MAFLTLDDVDVKDKVVLVRVDFNSPIDASTRKITDDVRIRVHGRETIEELADKGAKVVVLAHQGRKGGPDFVPLKEHAEILGKVLGRPVKYVDDIYGERAKEQIRSLKSGEILVLDNVRSLPFETNIAEPEDHAKTPLVQNLAPLADIFVLDAFSAAHRAHASITGFTAVLPSVAGRVMQKELNSLGRSLDHPEHPGLFILGGAKAEDFLEISRFVLGNGIADYVLTGGVIAQVFLCGEGYDLGKPNTAFLEQKNLIGLIPGIRELFQSFPKKILTPVDLAVDANGKRMEIDVKSLPTEHPIKDIGTKTVENYARVIRDAKSIVLRGPMGVYEEPEFALGTRRVFEEVANSRAFTLAGGGQTISALEEFGLADKISHVSTAGGALVEFLMGKRLPGVVALEAAARTDE